MDNKAALVLLFFTLNGCSAALVSYSSNPYQLLNNASTLLEQERPTPAERLITQALEICEKKQDPLCVAESYRRYGNFFMSAALNGQWKGHYIKNGFRDINASYDKRYIKAIEYFDKALPIFLHYKKYDSVTNVKLNTGFAYQANGETTQACSAFDASLAANNENLRLNPATKIVLPATYSSYTHYIAALKIEAGCSASGDST